MKHDAISSNPLLRVLGKRMNFRFIFILIVCLLSNGASANREFVLRSTSAKYEFAAGYRLELQASSDGEKLTSVTLSYKDSVMSIPARELIQVKRPVLSAVLVSGGSIESNNNEVPQAISIGFGTHHCELNDCPWSVIFTFNDLKFVETYVVKNGQ